MLLQSSILGQSIHIWARRTAGLGLIGAAFGLLLLLKELPYSSVRLVSIDPAEATKPPEPAFGLGPLHWPVHEFASAPALRPFREAMRASCGDAKGLAAAECAWRVISERVPFGNPSSEFVRTDFNPLAHFEEHMAGAPGHCLTFSAILATELLAVGIPARVVQLVPVEEKGHTLVEVWDEARGWVVVDPSSGGFLIGGPSRTSAVDLRANAPSVEWLPFAVTASSTAKRTAETRRFRSLLAGNVLYPEPWLYLRLGERVAPWPFRGEYARVGPAFLRHGPLQLALFWVIPILALWGLRLFASGWRRAARVPDATWDEALRANVTPVRELAPPSS